MLTKIEDALFQGKNQPHAITEFVISNDSISLKVTPWIETIYSRYFILKIKATFKKVLIISKEILEEPVEYPWNIIGFDSEPILNNRWDFYLCTDCIAYGFESDWPEIN